MVHVSEGEGRVEGFTLSHRYRSNLSAGRGPLSLVPDQQFSLGLTVA